MSIVSTLSFQQSLRVIINGIKFYVIIFQLKSSTSLFIQSQILNYFNSVRSSIIPRSLIVGNWPNPFVMSLIAGIYFPSISTRNRTRLDSKEVYTKKTPAEFVIKSVRHRVLEERSNRNHSKSINQRRRHRRKEIQDGGRSDHRFEMRCLLIWEKAGRR